MSGLRENDPGARRSQPRKSYSGKKDAYAIELRAVDGWGNDSSYTIGISTNKNYGNNSGSAYRVKTREEAIERLRRNIKRWEEYDSIAEHMGYKVTKHNTIFKAVGLDITLEEILHGQRGLKGFTQTV